MAYSLSEIAEWVDGVVKGDASYQVSSISSLEKATKSDLAFYSDVKYADLVAQSGAGVIVTSGTLVEQCGGNVIEVEQPHLAYALIAQKMTEQQFSQGVHPSAVIADSADIHPSAHVAANVSIGERVSIGASAVIGPNCVLDDDVVIGANTHLVASVTIVSKSQLGDRCLVHPGSVIGSDGFGNVRDGQRWVKIPQLGRVMIGNDVEIGACCAIDCGALDDTQIHDGVKLDNHIHVAHNCVIGENTAIAANTGIAGSTKIGANCTIAGMVGIIGHLDIADGTHVSATSTVTKSIRKAGAYTGTIPVQNHNEWRKNVARLKQLDDMARRIKALEKALADKD